MSQTKSKPPTYPQIIANLLEPLQGPLPLETLVEQILAVRPPQAKNPNRAVLAKIREADGDLLVRPDPHTVLRNKAARELDKAFSAINAIFSAKGDLDASENIIHLYSLTTAVQSIHYYAKPLGKEQGAAFALLAQKARELHQKVEKKEMTRKQLTPALNNLRQELIKNFAAVYNHKRSTKPAEK